MTAPAIDLLPNAPEIHARARGLLRKGRALIALPLFGLAMVATIWCATLLQLKDREREVLDGALRDTETSVAAYEQFVRRALKDADRTALLVKREFELYGTLNLRELVDAGLVDANNLIRAGMINANGNVIASSSAARVAINVADRDYFIQHRTADSGKLEISKPVIGRSSGLAILVLSRRVNHRDGSFAGVVAVTVAPDYFTRYYDESYLGTYGRLGVIGLDGSYRARRVGHESASAPETADATILAKAEAGPVGSYEGVSPHDGITRLIAYRKLEDYPLVITAAKEKGEVLVDFRRSAASSIAVAGLATVAIVVFFAILTALVLRLERQAAALAARKLKLEQLASFDALTGLPNRHLLQDRLVQALLRTSRYDARMALMFIDLDGFKEVNDTLGHDVGDLLLKAVADRLEDCVRESDSVCRFGGDEFVILLEPVLDAADARFVGERIIAALAPPFLIASHRIRTGASIGIALNPQDGIDATTLMKNADVAMYRAKKGGRNRFELYSVEPERDGVSA